MTPVYVLQHLYTATSLLATGNGVLSAQLWVQERQGRTWVTHWDTSVHHNAAGGVTVSRDREIPASWGISHASWGSRVTRHIHAQFCSSA